MVTGEGEKFMLYAVGSEGLAALKASCTSGMAPIMVDLLPNLTMFSL
jgi:hypothetical protein